MNESEKEAIRKARNAYHREWNKRNPEKVKAAQERYWLKKAAELAAGNRREWHHVRTRTTD